MRWSGEACWIPLGDLDVGFGPENATCYPAPGRDPLLPGRRQRDRDPVPLRPDRVREQGRRRSPATTSRRCWKAASTWRARPPDALGGRPADPLRGEVTPQSPPSGGDERFHPPPAAERIARGRASRCPPRAEGVTSSPPQKPAAPAHRSSTVTASSTSPSAVCSSGEWLIPPFRLRTNSIPVGTPAAARTPASWPAPRGARRAALRAARAARLSAALGSCAIATALTRLTSAGTTASTWSSRESSGARSVDTQPDTRRNHVRGSGLDLEAADRRHRAVDAHGRVPQCEHELGRRDERIRPSGHRRRPRMSLAALEDHLCTRGRHDPRDHAERRAGLLESRPLLDVELQEVVRLSLERLAESARAHAARPAPALLVPKGDDREGSLLGARPLDRLQPPDDPERTVETPPVTAPCRDASRSRPPEAPAGAHGAGRKGCPPGRPPPRARPRASSRPRAREPGPPPRCRRACSHRDRRRWRRAGRASREPAPGEP